MPDEPVQSSDSGRVPPSQIELAPGVVVERDTVQFSYARASGPGGQNVNKLATKATLRVRLEDLPISGRVRGRLERLAGRRVTTEGELVIISETERRQARNRALCLEKLRGLLVEALAEPKVRKKTKPSRGARERRLRDKRERSEIKRQRRSSGWQE